MGQDAEEFWGVCAPATGPPLGGSGEGGGRVRSGREGGKEEAGVEEGHTGACMHSLGRTWYRAPTLSRPWSETAGSTR